MTYAIVERMFDLSFNQLQEIRQNQVFVSGENKNYRPNSLKCGGSNELKGGGRECESSQLRGRTLWQRHHSQNDHKQNQGPLSCFI